MAVQLVNFKDGRTELQEDALSSVLLSEQARHRPVLVLSVTGVFRRGKSFLLNFMLRFLKHMAAGAGGDWMEAGDEFLQKGFDWRFDVNRVTSGISIWPEVFVINEMAVLLIDTQGTFDKETNLKENSAIMAISSLLSSTQIVNISERLQSNDLTDLQFFTEYGQLVEVHGSEETSKVFQNLVFLIRDWLFEEDFTFGFDGGIEYLNDFVSPTKKDGNINKVNEDFKSVQTMLKKCFESVRCFLMPHPGDKVASSKAFSGKMSEIEPAFKRELKVLVETILSTDQLKMKKIAGRTVTGEQLLNHVRVYINTLNSGQVPDPKTMFNILADEVARDLVNQAKDFFMEKMREYTGTDENTLKNHFEQFRQESVARFDKGHKLGASNHVQTFRNMLLQQIHDEHSRFVQLADSRRALEEMKSQWEEQCKVNKDLQGKIEDMKVQIRKKHEDIEFQNLRIKDLESKEQQSRQKVKEYQEKMSELREHINSVKEENEKHKSKNEELVLKMDENNRVLDEMQGRLQEQQENVGGFIGFLKHTRDAVGHVIDKACTAASDVIKTTATAVVEVIDTTGKVVVDILGAAGVNHVVGALGMKAPDHETNT